jgi:Flp pilus assembly protein TadD
VEETQTGNNETAFLESSKEKKTKAASDLEALKKIYEKNKADTILKQIIEKQAQNYQFNDAIENIKKLKSPEDSIDPQLYLYIAINSSALKV